MRLIDADNLVEILDEELETIKGGIDSSNFSTALKASILVGFAKHVINDAPTVEAVPVKHGRRIYPKESLWSLGKCSVCGMISVVATTANYCPMCGAKMDGGDGDAIPVEG